MGTGKQYDEEFKKQAIKLASFRRQTSGSKSSKRKTVSLKSLMNFWSKYLLFSPRTVGSQERITVKVHFQNVNFHLLRHTYATVCIENGFDAKTVSELLGYSNVNITLNRYVHSSLDTKKKYVEKLNFVA